MKRILTVVLFAFFVFGCKKDLLRNKNSDPHFIFNAYWDTINENFSFFDHLHVNWDSVYCTYSPKIDSQTSEDSLFSIISKATDLLHDAHTNIYSQFGIGGNIHYFDAFPINETTISDTYFESYEVGHVFDFGILKNNNIAYLKIKTFEAPLPYFLAIDSILTILNDSQSLIIDVRSNFGGDIAKSEMIASRFTDSIRLIGKYRFRNGLNHHDFSSWTTIFLAPAFNVKAFKKPIAILTNRRTYSAAEWFVLFAKDLPQIVTVGDTTGGGGGIPVTKELPNGWILRISNTQTINNQGFDFQNKGLNPDYPIWISRKDIEIGVDAILEKAIAILSIKK